MSAKITVSIVSHGQRHLVSELLRDLERIGQVAALAVVVTENLPEDTAFEQRAFRFPTQVVVNPEVKGFGANHNAAFKRCETPFFCVVNPDIRLTSDPFPPLLRALEDKHAAVAGPLVRSSAGTVEDSARRFPTLGSLVRKAFHERRAPDYPTDAGPVSVDWVAGMFMLLRSEALRAVGGFDERYFLYYEDVDLCWRLRKAGYEVVYEPRAEVTHDARRGSRRDFALARHHLRSALRFLCHH